MATQQHRIVSADESEIRDEPHSEGTRMTVRDVPARVEERHRRAAEEAQERSTLTAPEN